MRAIAVLALTLLPRCFWAQSAAASVNPAEVNAGSPAAAPALTSVDGDQSLFQQILGANSLIGKGKIPFHLKMTFQVYGLNAKPSEQGTIEQWWSESDGSRLDITAPSFGVVHSEQWAGLPNDQARRSLYLVGALLTSVRAPVSSMSKVLANATMQDKKISGVPLHCMESPEESNKPVLDARVCTDDTRTIRYIAEPSVETIRNGDAAFHGTRVAMTHVLFLAGQKTITGHIETLQGFDPAHTAVELERPAAQSRSSDSSETRVPGEVQAGRKLDGMSPSYPVQARKQHIAGTVLLAAEISREGKIDHLFPLASADPSLTVASMDAVKTWSYQPYLLNGNPVQVDTVITVNFNLSP